MFDAGLDDNDQNALFAFGRGVKSSYKKLYNSMCPLGNVGALARAYQLLKTLDDSDVDSGTALHCSNCGRNNHSTSHCRDLQRSSGANKPFLNKHIQHRPFSGIQKYQNKPPAPAGDVKMLLEKGYSSNDLPVTTHIAVVSKDTTVRNCPKKAKTSNSMN